MFKEHCHIFTHIEPKRLSYRSGLLEGASWWGEKQEYGRSSMNSIVEARTRAQLRVRRPHPQKPQEFRSSV